MIPRDEFIQIISEIKNNLSNPKWLAESLIKLSVFLVYSSEEIAQANLEENSSILSFIDSAGDKKVSKAEAEVRAISATGGKYKQLLLEREGIIETIQSIKKYMDMLNQDYRHG